MGQSPRLPGMAEEQEARSEPLVAAHAQRMARAVRDRIELVPRSLEDRVAAEHPARAIWALLGRLELGAFATKIRAAVDGPGRPASDPRVLLGRWMLATVEGIGVSRQGSDGGLVAPPEAQVAERTGRHPEQAMSAASLRVKRRISHPGMQVGL